MAVGFICWLQGNINGVICTAGGWAGGGFADKDVLSSIDNMWKMNLQGAVCSSYLAGMLQSKENNLLNYLIPGTSIFLA